MKTKLWVAGLGLLATSLGAYTYLDSPPPKWGGSPVGSDSGGEVVFWMNAAGTPDADDEGAVMASELGEWEGATGGNLDLTYGGTTPFGPAYGDGLNVVGWGSLGPGVGAVASPAYFGGTIEEADIEMNSDMDWSDGVLLENVLLHELGHCVGMDHEDDVAAVMASAVTGTTSLTPDDAAGISTLYGTGSGSTPPPPPAAPPVSSSDDDDGGGSAPADDDDGGGSKKFCIVATAAFGSIDHPRVESLRAFRDRGLRASAPGAQFSDLYRRSATGSAAVTRKSQLLRALVRKTLLK